MTSLILSCMLLAGFQLKSVETPIDEWATATINDTHNGVVFEATVFEGKLNSVMIEVPEQGMKTFSYSSRDYDQKNLTTMLDWKGGHSSIGCDIKSAK